MRFFTLCVFLFTAIRVATAQGLYFPTVAGSTGETMHPSASGWCPENIKELAGFLESNGTIALIILMVGRLVIEEYFYTFT